MPASARLRVSDYRALARLSHECRDLGADPAAWRLHLAAGLAPVAGAGFVSVVEAGLAADGSSVGSSCEWGWGNGFDEAAVRTVLGKIARDPFYNPMTGPYLAAVARDDGVSLSRPALVPDPEWYRSAYQDESRAAGADATLLCYRKLPGVYLSGLVLIRAAGEPDFTPRQAAAVREAHALIAPLIGGPLASFTDPSPAALPPRVRQVLRCLLEGDSDKQIAARLDLSIFTVNEYTKKVYRHFGAAGRADLLARWVGRGWGRRGPWANPPAG